MKLTPYQQSVIRGWIHAARESKEDPERTFELAAAAVEPDLEGDVLVLFDRHWPERVRLRK